MKRLACIALLALVSGCSRTPVNGGTLDGYPHLVRYDVMSYWTSREQFDDGVTCYRSGNGISCLIVPK